MNNTPDDDREYEPGPDSETHEEEQSQSDGVND